MKRGIENIKDEKFIFVTNQELTIDLLETFPGDSNYPYSFFVKLMQKLETEKDDEITFWKNRAMILRYAKDLTIVLNSNQEIVAWYLLSENEGIEGYDIVFFQTFLQKKGLGRELIDRLKAQHILYVTESLPGTAGFWKKMDITVYR
jgi:hypothetical protein